MAAMKFRESNQVKWIGTRPGHNGVQVVGEGTATDETTLMYTVPAGKILFLYEALLATGSLVAAGAGLMVRDDGDVFVRHLCKLQSAAVASFLADHFRCWPPYEIAAGYDVVVASGAAGLAVNGTFLAWVEDA